jgi:hypothetical protein
VRLFADGRHSGGKAIWVIAGRDVLVEGIDFHDAKVPDRNGAGIRAEGGNLTVRDSGFYDNENGILGGTPGSTMRIERAVFARNGYGDGYTHNLYVNAVDLLHVSDSWFREARIGHQVKSRARETRLERNYLMDGPAGTSSYLVDTPDGGVVTLRGNLMHKGPRADNAIAVAFGAEGLKWTDNRLTMVHNTLVMTRNGGTYVNVAAGTAAVTLRANLFAGTGSVQLLTGISASRVTFEDHVDGSAFRLPGADRLDAPSFWPDATLAAQLPRPGVPDPAYLLDAPAPRTPRAVGGGPRLAGALQAAP